MIAFSFAHFLVGTALRSFTSFILFSFVDYLCRWALSRTLESGAALHVPLVSNKMSFFHVCVGVWVRNVAQNLCASFPSSLASSLWAASFWQCLHRIFLHWVRTICIAVFFARGSSSCFPAVVLFDLVPATSLRPVVRRKVLLIALAQLFPFCNITRFLPFSCLLPPIDCWSCFTNCFVRCSQSVFLQIRSTFRLANFSLASLLDEIGFFCQFPLSFQLTFKSNLYTCLFDAIYPMLRWVFFCFLT